MVNALESMKMHRKIYQNSFVANVNMPVIHKNYIVCADNHTMNHNFIFAVINVKIGFMAAVLAYYKVKLTLLMSIFVQIANVIIL